MNILLVTSAFSGPPEVTPPSFQHWADRSYSLMYPDDIFVTSNPKHAHKALDEFEFGAAFIVLSTPLDDIHAMFDFIPELRKRQPNCLIIGTDGDPSFEWMRWYPSLTLGLAYVWKICDFLITRDTRFTHFMELMGEKPCYFLPWIAAVSGSWVQPTPIHERDLVVIPQSYIGKYNSYRGGFANVYLASVLSEEFPNYDFVAFAPPGVSGCPNNQLGYVGDDEWPEVLGIGKVQLLRYKPGEDKERLLRCIAKARLMINWDAELAWGQWFSDAAVLGTPAVGPKTRYAAYRHFESTCVDNPVDFEAGLENARRLLSDDELWQEVSEQVMESAKIHHPAFVRNRFEEILRDYQSYAS